MADFLSEAQSLFEYTRSLRRDFHAHPELGFHEVRTAGIVAKELNELGLEIQYRHRRDRRGCLARRSKTRSGHPCPRRHGCPANHRRDRRSYASQNPGVMHACGHDGHTAILLTVAKMLHAHRDELAGTVKFMFQPAEEGMGGAEKMIEGGVLENPKVDRVLGLHVWNEQPVGWFGIANGPMHGRGGNIQDQSGRERRARAPPRILAWTRYWPPHKSSAPCKGLLPVMWPPCKPPLSVFAPSMAARPSMSYHQQWK